MKAKALLLTVLVVSASQAIPPAIKDLKKKVYFSTEKFEDTTRNAHQFFIQKDALKCFLFGDDCSQAHRNSLVIIDSLLATEPAVRHLTKEMQDERLKKVEEVLRDKYEVSPEEFYAVGQPMLQLLLEGYRETNWMDRQLKKAVAQMKNGFDRIKNDEKLLNYLIYLYYGQMPDAQKREHVFNMLDPRKSPRRTGFEELMWGGWGYTKTAAKQTAKLLKSAYELAKEKWPKKEIPEQAPEKAGISPIEEERYYEIGSYGM